MNIYPPHAGLYRTVSRRLDPLPVDLDKLIGNPDRELSLLGAALGRAIAHEVAVAVMRGISLADCEARWINIFDSESNPDGARGAFEIHLLGHQALSLKDL